MAYRDWERLNESNARNKRREERRERWRQRRKRFLSALAKLAGVFVSTAFGTGWIGLVIAVAIAVGSTIFIWRVFYG